MKQKIAIIGGGVSGLTTGVMFAEHNFDVTILAAEIGQQTTSGAAAAVWFPYDAAPADKVISWALETHRVLVDLSRDRQSGVSMIELRQYSRTDRIEIPDWAQLLGGRSVSDVNTGLRPVRGFNSGFVIEVPLTDTTIYLDYLADRFRAAEGEIQAGIKFEKLEDVDSRAGLVINCAGIGARGLVNDPDLEPHRGQVVIVPKIDRLSFALACDETPLTYAIPRENDCVLGGTNDLSDNLDIDPASTSNIIAECSRVLNLSKPKILAQRVGLRPFRKSGVRLELDRLPDGRPLIHNYGHGGSGFTLSWGCAKAVLDLANAVQS